MLPVCRQWGRHTTSHRELFRLASGALLIDTPGMRELQLWGGEETLAQTFEDLDGIAKSCRFRDCQHEQEPGCAVQAALQSGDLAMERYQSFLKQRRELRFLARKQDAVARLEEEKRWKQITKTMRSHYKKKR